MKVISVVRICALALTGFVPSARAATYLTIAGNGDGIPFPTSTNTYAVTNSGKVIQVPEGMMYVPAGSFTYNTGTNATNVTIDGYAIGKFHVTCAEYKAFLDANTSVSAPSYWTNRMYPGGKSNHCVLYVSLTNALRYCAWVSSNTGWTVTIPTAYQWEKAARGTNAYLYPWGNSQLSSYSGGVLSSRMNYNGVCVAYYLNNSNSAPATYNDTHSPYYGTTVTVGTIAAYDTNGNATTLSISASGGVTGFVNHDTWNGFIYTDVFDAINAVGGTTTPVGSYTNGISGYGAYDMAGQCWDWTMTQFIASNGAEAGQLVNQVRGGSWYANGTSCRSIELGEGRLGSGAFNTIGFRVVMIPPAAASALTITNTSPLPGGTVGAAYAQTFGAAGGTNPYSWTVIAGALPDGLALNASGALNGTPTSAGAFNFTVQVTDGTNATATNAFALTIAAAPGIATASPLPDGTNGVAYSRTLAVTNGTAPFAWSVSAGALPGGISLSAAGVLSGTPTNASTFNFTAQVTDSAGAVAAKAFALTINTNSSGQAVHHFTWDIVPASASVGTPFNVRLTARDAVEQIVTNFNGTATLTATSGTGSASLSPVVITEMAPGSEAQMELQNVSGATVNTAGWFVRLNDDTNSINTVNATTFNLPASLAPGQIVRITESSSNTSGGRSYFGSAIAWSNVPNRRFGWIGLFDGTSSLRDFFVWGWATSNLTSLSIVVNSQTVTLTNQWSGVAATPGTGTAGNYTTDSFQRSGTSDSNATNGWAWFRGATNVDATTLGATNANLVLPWANTGGTPVAVTPTNVTFINGEFLGSLTITQAATGVLLTASDGSGHVGTSVAFDVTAPPANTAPVLAAIPNRTIAPGYRLALTNTATDADIPAQTLTFALLTAPTNVTLNSASGVLNWRPLLAQADTTNFFSVSVTDSGALNLGATQNFTVVVAPLTPPNNSTLALSNGQFRLLITGDAGPDYTIETSTDLVTWTALSSTNPPTAPFLWLDTAASNSPARFYRVILGP